MKPIRFTRKEPGGGRVHYLDSDDVLIVLHRLPDELWARLRAVHFNDKARGNRVLGYVTPARREIALCALPGSVSLGQACCNHRLSARLFGTLPRGQWPKVAIRRYLLYNTLLHEIGHLQIVDPNAKEPRRLFADETRAQAFADMWRKRLWSRSFDHPDPVHNPPTQVELATLQES
jgi:hypothetical protein